VTAATTAAQATKPAASAPVPHPVAEWAQDVLASDDPGGAPLIFTLSDKRHRHAAPGQGFAERVKPFESKPDVYFSAGTFAPGDARKAENARRFKSVFIDLDCEPDKANKYQSKAVALRAGGGFSKLTGLHPTHIVDSGRGIHFYYALTESVDASTYKGLSARVLALANREGLMIDPAVMDDAARIMRLPGTVNSKNDAPCVAYRRPRALYTLAEIEALLPEAAPSARDMSVNADVTSSGKEFPPSDLAKVVAECPAMAEIAAVKGDVPEPQWRAMLGLVKHVANGENWAHELSSGYPSYDPDETKRKIDAWAAGPTTCAEFSKHTKACDGCAHKGKITSPIVLGRAAPTLAEVAAPVPEWAAELNARYAVVRIGATVQVLDAETPTETAGGVKHGPGWLTVAAFQQMHRGRFAPVEKPVDKAKSLTDAWLSHPQRRQFEGAVFAPGEVVPASVLNLYAGHGVEPVQGDVSLWLEVLAAVAPDAATRAYVLNWLATKVQNPGSVPGTILLVTGAKGCGKNSLFEPVVRIFGAHGRVFDDAEQIAGRFTGHLQTVAFAILDEALFAGNREQGDRIKSRVTATSMSYESKGLTPIQGVNRCAYASLTNHTHVWQATIDERRAVVVEAGNSRIGNRAFWTRYHAWLNGPGPAALLFYLQSLDVSQFDPREIPKGEALRRQIEHTTLREPAAAWWHTVLSEGIVIASNGIRMALSTVEPTAIDKSHLREAFQASQPNGLRRPGDWAQTMRKLKAWAGATGIGERKVRDSGDRVRLLVLPPLGALREAFAEATGVRFDELGAA
jgi:Family of unknown function (DUF5906)